MLSPVGEAGMVTTVRGEEGAEVPPAFTAATLMTLLEPAVCPVTLNELVAEVPIEDPPLRIV